MEILTEAIRLFAGGKEILQGIDFSLQNGEFVGLIGPNGSGKSSFLKCLYRVLRPAQGKIYFNGRNLDEFSYRESALQMAVVAQHNFYNFDFTVLEVVLMGRAPHKRLWDNDSATDIKIAYQALSTVGLQHMAERSFQSLSGGEQQRVILARALTQGTNCLILDEPTNHLDIKYQLQVMDIVKNLRLTTVAAIHDLNIAAMYCDRLVALQAGKIIGAGKPSELLTEAFIRQVYEVECRVLKLPDGQLHIRYLRGNYYEKNCLADMSEIQ